MPWKNRLLWILQIFFGIYFIIIGVLHFVLPEGLPGPIEWMYDLGTTTHVIVGIAEVLGGLGLILPSVTRIRPELTVYAAVGLVLVMMGAIIWHATRSETSSLAQNVIIAALVGFVAYGRAKLYPIEAKS
ncbi:MAG: DoxX family protein [Acidimicrobiia bacterium]|nr:DoxX family protein [Acidimicrobiia bacterium]